MARLRERTAGTIGILSLRSQTAAISSGRRRFPAEQKDVGFAEDRVVERSATLGRHQDEARIADGFAKSAEALVPVTSTWSI